MRLSTSKVLQLKDTDRNTVDHFHVSKNIDKEQNNAVHKCVFQ